MRRAIGRAGVALLPLWVSAALGEATPAPKVVPLARSVSSSQQFVIYQSNATVRSRLARKVEDLKTNWLQRFKISDEWKAPIIVQLATVRPANSPDLRTSLYESDDREMKVQIDVFDPSVLNGPAFDLEVFRALLLEYGYRGAPPKAGKAFQRPPAWLAEGLYADLEARQEGVPSGLFEQLIKSGTPPKLEAFLKEKPELMDATSRAIYRARAMALLRALLAMPDGPAHLAAYCATLHSVNPADADKLTSSFPELAQPGTLARRWMLALADASASNRAKPFSVLETEKQLTAILEISVPASGKKPPSEETAGPEELQALARLETGRYQVRQKAESLLRLEVRAHPLMRPIVEEYRIIASELSIKPKKNFRDRLRKNRELELVVVKRAAEIDDYLNWFEAAQLDLPSKQFEGALDVEEISAGFRRADPVGRHLDGIEARGW